MQLHLYQIDAFTDEIFSGNPACVVPLSEWPSDDLLLQIAQENAVAETAFFVDNGFKFHLRWFTPEMEMDLCGHATLATAHALKQIRKYKGKKIIFETQSGEMEVMVEESADPVYTLNFPSRQPEKVEMPELLGKSINLPPQKVLKARDLVLVYENEEEVRNIEINRLFFDKMELGTGGVIFTAPGKDCDFVSRFFTPRATVFEDPVTGSAHCSLIPYWSKILKKKKMIARQISERGGIIHCENLEDRVLIGGKARTYSIGKLYCR